MKGIALVVWEVPDDYYSDDPLRPKDCKRILSYIINNSEYLTDLLHMRVED